MILSVLKFVAVPGSLPFLVLCLILGTALHYLWPRHRRWWRRGLFTIGVAYLILSLPVVANALSNRLTGGAPAGAGLARLDALIVFDGDNRRGRVAETLRVLQTSPAIDVWVLGDDWMLTPLGSAGIAPAKLHYDADTPTTRDQTAWVARFVAAAPQRSVGVIASRLQAPRIDALFKASNLAVTLLPSPLDAEPPTSGIRLFLPSYIGLRTSRDAIYELVAIPYYRWEGWID